MKVPPLSQLKETDLQINGSTDAGKQLLAAFRNLFDQLNPWISAVNKLTARGVSFSDNVQCELVGGTFSHGVPQQVKLKVLSRAAAAVALGALGEVAIGATITMVQPPAAQQNAIALAQVTVYFADPTAVNVQTSVLLLPEGQQA